MTSLRTALRTLCVAFLVAGAAVLPATTDAFRVLGVLPYNARSHNIMLKAMMEVLADRGHEVVVLSPFPQKQPRANYTDLDLSEQLPYMVNQMTYEQITSLSRLSLVKAIGYFSGPELCRQVFQTKHFQDVMAGVHGKFDVVFTEIFGSDCYTAVAHKLDLPLISIATAPDYAWMHERVGSVDNPSYLIAYSEPKAGKLNFWQRAQNVLMYTLYNWVHYQNCQAASDPIVREYFGPDTPPIRELVKRTSLVMVNNHVSLNPARPVTPNVIHVGGLHLKDARHGARPDPTGKGMEPALRQWMDEAEHGVILFTLGSLVRANSLPRDAVQALIQTFAALPQRVLWKYESDDIAHLLPPNVRTASWMPQMDVLAHKNTILFMTHGGLMGVSEAVLLGVPMLGIPLFADQPSNMEQLKLLGVAENVQHTELTKDNLLTTIRKLTETDKYRVRAKELSALYRDRPLSAADWAGWWTEYVVRNHGAPHLRPLGADMPLYQYLLLDVVALVVGLVVAVLLVLRALLRALLSRITSSATKASKKRPKKE